MKILVTGGAGFIGSHLIDRLMTQGHSVICVDNLFTGRKSNLAQWLDHPNFALIIKDVIEPFGDKVIVNQINSEPIDQVYHLACPASPVHYQADPIWTAKTNFQGTLNAINLAERHGARLLLASTSEIYGDPLVHPQKEDYWGNVNSTGIRSCYDEGKRIAETLVFDAARQYKLEVRVARIFNTYGDRMLENDGRVVSNFVVQALKGEPLTVYGDGTQTRSFCFVDDLVNGLMLLMNSEAEGPVNLGNPDEYTIAQLASVIQFMINPGIDLVFSQKPLPLDDPQRRKPDISKAMRLLGWGPEVSLAMGLMRTIEYFRNEATKARGK